LRLGGISRRDGIMQVVKWIAIIAAAVVLVPLLTTIVLWAATLPIWQSERDDCVFNTVSNTQYRHMLDQAKRQSWTVWPGSSDGVFWPSDRGLGTPSPQFEPSLGGRLRVAIDELAGDHASTDVQLAAAHALMRSIGAKLVSIFEIPDFPQGGRQVRTTVQFRYFLSQRRFAPLCLTCVIWRYTTISVNFEHDLVANAYKLNGVVVLHGDLKYDPDPVKERNVNTSCPSFPVTGRK
jgi:hypothetical protein